MSVFCTIKVDNTILLTRLAQITRKQCNTLLDFTFYTKNDISVVVQGVESLLQKRFANWANPDKPHPSPTECGSLYAFDLAKLVFCFPRQGQWPSIIWFNCGVMCTVPIACRYMNKFICKGCVFTEDLVFFYFFISQHWGPDATFYRCVAKETFSVVYTASGTSDPC